VFKQLDLSAQRRLGNAQSVRCLAEAPEFGDESEGGQLAKVY
jgi:hypothetical protein